MQVYNVQSRTVRYSYTGFVQLGPIIRFPLLRIYVFALQRSSPTTVKSSMPDAFGVQRLAPVGSLTKEW
jgi:hypothetical protein